MLTTEDYKEITESAESVDDVVKEINSFFGIDSRDVEIYEFKTYQVCPNDLAVVTLEIPYRDNVLCFDWAEISFVKDKFTDCIDNPAWIEEVGNSPFITAHKKIKSENDYEHEEINAIFVLCKKLVELKSLRKHVVSNRYTLQDMIDAYDAGVWNPNDETAKEYMKREYNVC